MVSWLGQMGSVFHIKSHWSNRTGLRSYGVMRFLARFATFLTLLQFSSSLTLFSGLHNPSRSILKNPKLAFHHADSSYSWEKFLLYTRPARKLFVSLMSESQSNAMSNPATSSKKTFIHPGFETGAAYGLGFGVSLFTLQ